VEPVAVETQMPEPRYRWNGDLRLVGRGPVDGDHRSFEAGQSGGALVGHEDVVEGRPDHLLSVHPDPDAVEPHGTDRPRAEPLQQAGEPRGVVVAEGSDAAPGVGVDPHQRGVAEDPVGDVQQGAVAAEADHQIVAVRRANVRAPADNGLDIESPQGALDAAQRPVVGQVSLLERQRGRVPATDRSLHRAIFVLLDVDLVQALAMDDQGALDPH
jgi:hypothetical protein